METIRLAFRFRFYRFRFRFPFPATLETCAQGEREELLSKSKQS